MASIKSLYKTAKAQNINWLLWPTILLLMTVLGGLAVLGPLFNSSSKQAWLCYKVARNCPVGSWPDNDNDSRFCKFVQYGVQCTSGECFISSNVEKTISASLQHPCMFLVGSAFWFQ